MTIWTICNPSDPYTMECDRFDIAAIAAFMVGGGMCPAHEVDGDRKSPFCLGGGWREWFTGEFGKTAESVLESEPLVVAKCLRSIVLGRPADRKTFTLALSLIPDDAGKKAFADHWLDSRRTSMNDIGGRAIQQAIELESQQVEVRQ